MDVDYLVLGSGIAGLSFALKVSKLGRVALVTKKSDTESNTNYAQGGIAGVIAPDDSFDLHIRDTLVAGAGLCRLETVEILVREGPERIRELVELGVQFSREKTPTGETRFALGREGGHSMRRILHAADLTGREIERALIVRCKHQENIRTFEHECAIDLITRPGDSGLTCCGAYVLDAETEEVTTFRARVTMLATGGAGQVYLHTTNPEIATGDGVAMAYRAGAGIANMEFIQFHPTSLHHPEARSFLISEAVRGEGGILRLRDGSTFMENYHEMGCLAPRDIVARAIDAELKKSGDECVYLDVTHLDAAHVRERFPTIYQKCLSVGIDITEDWIPIVPAAHYSCGGVLTDVNARSSVERLYACGEVACTGVHGANRLASNSLLEAVVFAHRAAGDSEQYMGARCEGEIPDFPKAAHSRQTSLEEIAGLKGAIRRIMWRYVGIVRTNERLQKAKDQLAELAARVDAMYESGRLSSDLLELRNMVTTASLIIESAISRKESRGLNYNLDYPKLDENTKDTVLNRGS
ncbi:MAG: L-aspartate oxidase [Armatimonadetes bacterium]|nr:L-aspartate oxidase [Armatimonadota bacterium]